MYHHKVIFLWIRLDPLRDRKASLRTFFMSLHNHKLTAYKRWSCPFSDHRISRVLVLSYRIFKKEGMLCIRYSSYYISYNNINSLRLWLINDLQVLFSRSNACCGVTITLKYENKNIIRKRKQKYCNEILHGMNLNNYQWEFLDNFQWNFLFSVTVHNSHGLVYTNSLRCL